MKAAARAAELDKVLAVMNRMGFRATAWTSDDGVIVDEVYGESPLFAVWGPVTEEERVDAGGLPAAIGRARAAARRKAAR